jgi:hypothetical protein
MPPSEMLLQAQAKSRNVEQSTAGTPFVGPRPLFFQFLIRSRAIQQVAGSGLAPDAIARQIVTHPSRMTLTLRSLTVSFEAFARTG